MTISFPFPIGATSAEIQSWQEAIQRAMAPYHQSILTIRESKGPNETAWLARSKKKSVRWSPKRKAEGHESKEAYCAYLLKTFTA